jgi:hypothetical protein
MGAENSLDAMICRPHLDYAVEFVRRVCQLAGPFELVETCRADLRRAGILQAVRTHDTPALFNWLMEMLSFQGIADWVAEGFLAEHGNATWAKVAQALADTPACPKLSGYWTFFDCRYQKGAGSCGEPALLPSCPLPRHQLRNGHLNQLAYSLFLFIRDVAGGDLVSWVDQQLAHAEYASPPDRLLQFREALVGPLRNIYGISDKVAALVLTNLLLGAGRKGSLWFEVGASFIVIDRLIHNFLHRTGILKRFGVQHPYGAACYRPSGCAGVVRVIADEIDAQAFNPGFSKIFPRFVQSAIWRYCAEGACNICNGNRIDDWHPCQNIDCRLYSRCDHIALRLQLAAETR